MKFLVVLLVVLMVGCGTIEIKEVPIQKPKLQVEMPTLKFERVQFYTINGIFMLNEEDYKRLLINNEAVYNYILQLKNVLNLYKEYYEESS